MERHHRLIARAMVSPRTRLSVLGRTPGGQDLDLLTIGEPGGTPGTGKKACWIITRQHPRAPAGSWLLEDVLERLLGPEAAISRALRDRAALYAGPHVDPAGSRRAQRR